VTDLLRLVVPWCLGHRWLPLRAGVLHHCRLLSLHLIKKCPQNPLENDSRHRKHRG
jgi:hypothetical protein